MVKPAFNCTAPHERICAKCVHRRWRLFREPLCEAKKSVALDLVTGKPLNKQVEITCRQARADRDNCGVIGRFFKYDASLSLP